MWQCTHSFAPYPSSPYQYDLSIIYDEIEKFYYNILTSVGISCICYMWGGFSLTAEMCDNYWQLDLYIANIP